MYLQGFILCIFTIMILFSLFLLLIYGLYRLEKLELMIGFKFILTWFYVILLIIPTIMANIGFVVLANKIWNDVQLTYI